MKTGITFSKSKFYVDEHKKTVICSIKITFIDRVIEFKGKSKCSPEDTFDAIKGKRIAESRAKAKAYSIAARIYREYEKFLMDKLFKARDKADFCEFLTKREALHIIELSNK